MGFTGHINDATGLTYMQARFYDPVTARFLSVDPVTFMGGGNNPAMYNRFSYAFNDPVNMWDPDGEMALYLSFQATFQIGGVGGRINAQIGYDTETKKGFIGYAKGGSGDISQETPEAMGAQIGVGAGLGIAESSDYVVAEAYTLDADIGVISVSVASNDPLINSEMNMGDPFKDPEPGDSTDTRIRQVEVGVGIGAGGSQIKTSGDKIDFSIPRVTPKESDLPSPDVNNETEG